MIDINPFFNYNVVSKSEQKCEFPLSGQKIIDRIDFEIPSLILVSFGRNQMLHSPQLHMQVKIFYFILEFVGSQPIGKHVMIRSYNNMSYILQTLQFSKECYTALICSECDDILPPVYCYTDSYNDEYCDSNRHAHYYRYICVY